MLKRVYKQIIFKTLRWILYLGIIYGVIVLLTGEPSKIENKDVFESEMVMTKKPRQKSKLRETLKEPTNEQTEPHQYDNLKDNADTDTEEGQQDPFKNPNVDEEEEQQQPTPTPLSANKVCPGTTFPEELPAEESWYAIDKAKTVYVFSAYFNRDKGSVFVIAAKSKRRVSVVCQIWEGNKEDEYFLIEESTPKEPEGFIPDDLQYTATVYECPVHATSPPAYVSLVTKQCASPSNVLLVQSATKELPFKHRVTVCLKPLVQKYDRTLHFVQWVEINRLLGVDKFVVYDFSVGPNIEQVLKYYSGQGLLEVVQWKPPMVVERLPPYNRSVQLDKYGETAALNDCLFRNKRHSKFVSNIGVNEFIISKINKNMSISETIAKINMRVPAYYFSMAFVEKVPKKQVGKPNEVKPFPDEANYATRIVYKPGYVRSSFTRMVMHTEDVDFTTSRRVEGAAGYNIQPDRSVLHVHSGTGKSQLMGTTIDTVLPADFMDKIRKEVQGVTKNLKHVIIK